MKTLEELFALRNEYETLRKKLAELSEPELTQVIGGVAAENGPCPSYKLFMAIGYASLGTCDSCAHKKFDKTGNRWYCELGMELS